MHRSLALLAALCLTTLPGVTLAQGPAPTSETAPDEVVLKNGGMVRGTVVSLDPGHQVVITVPGVKDARTIPWAEIADVERGKYAPHPAAPAAPVPPPVSGYAALPPPPAAAPRAAASGPGVVRLHIQSDVPVELHERRGFAVATMYGAAYVSASRRICASPCDQVVDGRQGQGYFVTGEGIPSSNEFQLGAKQGDVTAQVDPGSSAARGGGIALVAVGAAGMAAGLVLLLTGALESSTDIGIDSGSATTTSSSGGGIEAAGGVALGVGAAALIGGIVLIVTNRTKVELARESTTTAPVARAPRYYLGEF